MNTEVPGGDQPDHGTDDAPADGFVLRMLLGSQLRRLREEAGIAPVRVGYEAGRPDWWAQYGDILHRAGRQRDMTSCRDMKGPEND